MADDGFEPDGPDPSPAQRILELSDLPAVDPEDRPGGGVSGRATLGGIDRLSGNTLDFMEELRNQLPLPQSADGPDRPSREDPFGAYLEDTARQIQRGVKELRETARRDLGQSSVGEIVCCVVIGIYRIVLNESSKEATYDAMREVPRERVISWLRIFRDMLINIRQVGMGRQAIAGFRLNMLSIDVSATIYRTVESLMAGILMAFLSWVETKIGQLHRRLADTLRQTQCQPLIRLWSSVLNWLYDQSRGLVSRLRGLVQDVIIRMHRKIQSMMQSVPSSAGGQISLSGDSRRMQRVDDIILVLDALIDAVDVFETCRLPPPEDDGSGEDESGGEEEEEEEEDGGAGGGTGGGRGRPDPSRLTETFDPDLGRISTLDVEGPAGETQDTIYLTPTNVAKALTQEFGVGPQEATDLAAEQSCRDELSDETEAVLQEIGLFDG